MNVPLAAGCGGDFGTSLSHGTGLGIGGGRGRLVGAAFGHVGGWSWDESTSLPAGLASEFLKPCQDDGQHDHAAGTLCIMHSLHHRGRWCRKARGEQAITGLVHGKGKKGNSRDVLVPRNADGHVRKSARVRVGNTNNGGNC